MRVVLGLFLLSLHLSNAALHRQQQLPDGWHKSEIASLDDTKLSFAIHLKESSDSMATLKKIANAVSDPNSNQYGQFLSSEAIVTMTSVSASTFGRVRAWLDTVGVTATTVASSRIEFSCSQAQTPVDPNPPLILLLPPGSGLSAVRHQLRHSGQPNTGSVSRARW